MTTLLPTDANNNAIPAVRLKPDGAHRINTSDTGSQRNQSAFNPTTRIVSLYATAPVYLAFGDDTITADNTDHYFPSGVYYDFAIGGGRTSQYSHIAALAVDGEAILYISEKE